MHPGTRSTNAVAAAAPLADILGGLGPGENIVWIFAGQNVPSADLCEISPAGSVVPYRVLLDGRGGNLGDRVLDPAQAIEAASTRCLLTIDLRGARATALTAHAEELASLARAVLRGKATGSWLVDETQTAARWLRELSQIVVKVTTNSMEIARADGRTPGAGVLLRIDTEGGHTRVRSAPRLTELGRALRALRAQRQLSQAELGQVIGISGSAISQVERGQHALSFDAVVELSRHFAVSMEYLAFGTKASYSVSRREPDRSAGGDRFAAVTSPALGIDVLPMTISARGSSAPSPGSGNATVLIVIEGLVQAHVAESPVILRTGDGLTVAAGVPITCDNIDDQDSHVLWIVPRGSA